MITRIFKTDKEYDLLNNSSPESIIIISKEKDIFSNMEEFNVGLDIYNLEDFKIKPGQYDIIKSGVKVYTPEGIHFEVRPRSSLFIKTGLLLVNSPGTIDPSYRGDVGMILYNPGQTMIEISKETKLCQIMAIPYYSLYSGPEVFSIQYNYTVDCYISKNIYENFDNLIPSNRGSEGFGSSGGYKN